MTDRVEPWDPSRWRRTAEPDPNPLEGAEHEHAEPGAADVLDAQRWRNYTRGQVYAVFVPSPFASVNPEAAPVLRYRVCADPGDREAGRDPVFVTVPEWAATCGADAETRLAELERQVEELEGVPECFSVKRAAQFLGLSDKTVYKLIRDGELEAFKVGSQHRIPSQSLEELQQRRSAPATEAEDSTPDADMPRPLFNPNFRRDAAS